MVDVESFPCRLELETGRLSRESFRVVGSSSGADDSVEVDGVGVLAVGRVHDCYVDIVAFYDSEHWSWNSVVKGPVAVCGSCLDFRNYFPSLKNEGYVLRRRVSTWRRDRAVCYVGHVDGAGHWKCWSALGKQDHGG